MGLFADLSIRVTSFDHQPVRGAEVTAEREGRTIATAATDDRGRCRIERDDDDELLIRVEASGFAGDRRVVSGERPEDVELFVLGRPGMPFYYRGTVKVPFAPVADAVGFVMRSSAEGGDVAARARGLARRLGAEVLRAEGNFARSGIAVVRVAAEPRPGRLPTGPGERSPSEELLDRLDRSEEVELAGALVQLFDDHASFLTNTVIARFTEGVDDGAATRTAARHGLVPEGRIDALGNVYRLRFSGPATYAVLDASNALAEEPEVLYAEPDLVHTVEDDAVIPTDFLFPQQWDHRLIDTPDAWEVLRGIDPNLTFGSPEVTIAIVDRGVDTSHPEFSGDVSNGQPKLYRVYDFHNLVASMNDLDGDHGTGCASAATANADNPSAVAGVNEGIAGIAGNCRLIAARRPQNGGPEVIYAIMYLWAGGLPVPPLPGLGAISPGADIISSSYGTSVGSPISGLMRDVFDLLTDKGRGGRGTLLFFSAGNDNKDLDGSFARPWSMYKRCFGVAASTVANDGVTEIKARYSNFGSTVDYCAPSGDNECFVIVVDKIIKCVHDPPTLFAVHTATVVGAPEQDPILIPGRPDRQTTMAAAAAPTATTLTLTTTAGMAAGQAVLIGASGAAGTEARKITAVNAVASEITVDLPLRRAHGVGTFVASGPPAYRTGSGGTSYSTPVCAGTAALMLSAAPHLRWEQVGDILRDTATKIDPNNTDPLGRWRDATGRKSTDPGYAGPVFSEFFGFGRIRASAAVRAAAATPVQAEVWTTDGQGNMARLAAHTGWRGSWTAIVPGNFGGSSHTDLLFYDAAAGHGEFYTTDGQGNIKHQRLHEGWRTSWTAIVPGNFGGGSHTDLLFYDAAAGHGEFYSTNGQGRIKQLRLHEDWRTSWKIIVPGNFGGNTWTDLLFYDAANGHGEFYTTDGQGRIKRLRLHEDWRTSWTIIVAGDFGGSSRTDLLFYDAVAGHGEFYTTDGQGRIKRLRLHEDWRTSWTAIVPGNFGGSAHTDLLFYDAAAGHGEFYSTDGQGRIKRLRLHEDWRTSWKIIVPGNFGGSAHTDLLFYER